MLFNSLHFVLFFPLVATAYFLLPHRFRWVLLLAASYYFYGSWSWKYLALLLLTTAVDWIAALRIAASDRQPKKRAWLIASLVCNLGVLFTFKYFNFFIESAREAAAAWGLDIPYPGLELLLPVGISFYTFQSISYTVDVYRGLTPPQRHLGKYALFVAFFPQLVAGPIERSWHLMPQFDTPHKLDLTRIRSGALLMLVGFFKKLVIADRLALYVDAVYNNPADYEGWPLIVETYFFAFQIYCDFSGYSDIAVGGARILGFDLMRNFKRPYFATSIVDFWHRWHISLSTWMRDYLYIPLGGNRATPRRVAMNLFIVFVLSGLWHGANWTFVVWGALHGGYICIARYFEARRTPDPSPNAGSGPSTAATFLKVVVTFHLVLFAWIFFRADTLTNAYLIIIRALEGLGASPLAIFDPIPVVEFWTGLFCVGLLLGLQYLEERGRPLEGRLNDSARPLRWAVYCVLLLCVLFFGKFTSQQFIYFQF
ncbi:MAG TPA: MBOAT family O-acyltransferase [Candidatus Hydrogenedentes bacterium]|nr:MBOAT family O-acyltransferase [Candidatus Hydrogenedentota bacterium]